MEQMIERYEELYKDMASAKDVEKMHVFGAVGKWMFCQLVETNPRAAQMALDKLEAMYWNNYLSDAEAKEICAELVNQDGTTGAKWGKDAFLQVVEKHDGEVEKKPYFNDNALWVTADMIYSDHAKSIAEDMGAQSVSAVPAEKMAYSCYRKAVEKLCDRDRKHFVRQYFAEELE